MTEKEAALLRVLVWQWCTSHDEYCAVSFWPWPHGESCRWPMPEVMSREMPAVTLLLEEFEDLDRNGSEPPPLNQKPRERHA